WVGLSIALSLYLTTAAIYVAWLGHPRGADRIPHVVLTLGALLFPLMGLAALSAVVGGIGVAVFSRSLRERATSVGGMALAILISMPLVTRLAWKVRREWLGRIVTEAAPLVKALSAAKGARRADELVAAFPIPGLASRHFDYHEADGRWELSLTTPAMF